MNYPVSDLLAFADQLLQSAGLPPDKAKAVADVLLEGDLLGHTTHGLALLAPYMAELESGKMRKEGQPLVVSDHPAAVTWDGQRLPGPWLVLQAIDLATQRARSQGTCTVVIRRSHHIACLAAYHQRVTEQGFMMLLHCSDPNAASIAPFGGLDPVFTPNPMAFGIPTGGDPILVDVSCSITTNGMSGRLVKEGKKFPAKWLLDDKGERLLSLASRFESTPNDAYAALSAGKLESSQQLYNQLLKSDPRSIDAHLGLADIASPKSSGWMSYSRIWPSRSSPTRVAAPSEISSMPSRPQTTSARCTPSCWSTRTRMPTRSGWNTPIRMFGAPAGLVSGPRMLKMVRTPSSRRTGATFFIAG